MNSSRGMRGVICERFGWTLEYLENGIPWMDVHEMMVDAPMYIPPEINADTSMVPAAQPGQPAPPTQEEAKSKAQRLNSFLGKYL